MTDYLTPVVMTAASHPSAVTAALDRVYRKVDATKERAPQDVVRRLLERVEWLD